MRCIVINLPLAEERRESIHEEFSRVGLTYQLWTAISSFDLTNNQKCLIDNQARERIGLNHLGNGAIACLLSHLAVLHHLTISEDKMVAIFEDDARLHPDLPKVLNALEKEKRPFDIVKLQRRKKHRLYYPVYSLMSSYSLGRVKYHDPGAYGYVITRRAAHHLLDRFPRPACEIDGILPKFWENGLRNILYVDPPVIFHDDTLPSYIEGQRSSRTQRNLRILGRRAVAYAMRAIRRWYMFRSL